MDKGGVPKVLILKAKIEEVVAREEKQDTPIQLASDFINETEVEEAMRH